jgi:hypothetical protein
MTPRPSLKSLAPLCALLGAALLLTGAAPRDMDRRKPAGLVAGLTFNRANAYDVTGLSMSGTATFLGGVAAFNGTANNLASSTTPGTSPAYSVSAWIKFAGIAESVVAIAQREATAANQGRWQISYSTASNDVVFRVAPTAGASVPTQVLATDPVVGTWYHFVGVCTGGTNGNILGYRDGALISTTAYTGTPSTSTSVLRIAKVPWLGTYFHGSVDDVRIYDRALTSAEIAQLYQSTRNETRP